MDKIKALTGIDVTTPPPHIKTQTVTSNRDKATGVNSELVVPTVSHTASNPIHPASPLKTQCEVTTASDSQPNVKYTQIHKPSTFLPPPVTHGQNCDIISVPHAAGYPKNNAINSCELNFDQNQSRIVRQSSTNVPHATDHLNKDAKNNCEPKFDLTKSKAFQQGSHGPDLLPTATPTRPKHHQLPQPNKIPGAHAFDLVDIASPTTVTPLSSSVRKMKIPVLDHDDVKVLFSSFICVILIL